MSKSILQRIPDALLARVEEWGEAHGEINRTVAVNLLIVKALEADEIKLLHAEIEGLKRTVVKLNRPYAHTPLITALQKAAEAFAPENLKRPGGYRLRRKRDIIQPDK